MSTIQPGGSDSITTQNLVPAGAATAGSAVELVLSGNGGLGVQVTGTYTGALSLQATIDGATWVTLAGAPLLNVATGVGVGVIPSAAAGLWQADVSGFVRARITALGAVTGTANITLLAIAAASVMSIDSSSNSDGVADAVIRSDTVSSATSSPTIATAGYGSIVFQTVANASANTIIIEGSNDGGTTWSTIASRLLSAATGLNVTTFAPAAASLYMPATIMPLMRWRVSTYVAGSTTVAIGMKRGGVPTTVDAVISTALPTGGNTLGVVLPSLGTGASSGMPLATNYQLSAAATTNSQLISSGTRRMVAGQLYNKSAAVKFVKFFNKATAPTIGTDVPVLIVAIPAAGVVNVLDVIGPFGKYFNLGLGIGITGAWTALDTTAVALDDVDVSIEYL